MTKLIFAAALVSLLAACASGGYSNNSTGMSSTTSMGAPGAPMGTMQPRGNSGGGPN